MASKKSADDDFGSSSMDHDPEMQSRAEVVKNGCDRFQLLSFSYLRVLEIHSLPSTQGA